MAFQRRDPFAPFLSRLPAAKDIPTLDDLQQVKTDIEKITEQIHSIKTILHSTSKWTEELEDFIRDKFVELVRMVDKSLADDAASQTLSSIKSQEDQKMAFFGSPIGNQLLQDLKNRIEVTRKEVEGLPFKPSPDLLHPRSTSPSSSSPPERELEQVIKHEKDLERRAEDPKEQDPGRFILWQSYEDLENQLKQCLLCFSAFPANQIIKKRTIIYWWIGEELVSATRDGRTAEQVGKDCFKMLINSGLIEPIYQKLSRTVNYCKIYTWVRQMLIFRAQDAKFLTFRGDRPILDHEQCKRACLSANEKVPVAISSEGKANECISLFNFNAHYLHCEEDKLEKFRALATMQLGRWQNLSSHHVEVENDSFLNALKSLSQLKYLSLHGISRITELPDSIANLTHLLILDLRSCHNLENITTAITSLSSITHLDVSGCYLLDKMPRGIGSMSNLQVLKGFVVGGARSKDPCQLSELSQLQKLWKLSIRIGSEAQVDKDLIELREIKSLRSLRITWGVRVSPVLTRKLTKKKSLVSKSSVTNLTSFPELEKLALECVPNDEVSWLKPDEFPKLKRLYIEGGKLKSLSLAGVNGIGWKIEILRLKFLKNLNLKVWSNVTKDLQKLRGAQIIDCPKIDISLAGFDENGIWERSIQEISSRSMARTAGQEGARTEAGSSSSSSSKVGTSLVSEIEESSSSSIVRTS